jgi:hypothetical protein
MNMNESAKVCVHPATRGAYAAERLRRAATLESNLERQKFLEEAIKKYGVWAAGLGVAPHKVSADLALLRCQFFPSPQKQRA